MICVPQNTGQMILFVSMDTHRSTQATTDQRGPLQFGAKYYMLVCIITSALATTDISGPLHLSDKYYMLVHITRSALATTDIGGPSDNHDAYLCWLVLVYLPSLQFTSADHMICSDHIYVM